MFDPWLHGSYREHSDAQRKSKHAIVVVVIILPDFISEEWPHHTHVCVHSVVLRTSLISFGIWLITFAYKLGITLSVDCYIEWAFQTLPVFKGCFFTDVLEFRLSRFTWLLTIQGRVMHVRGLFCRCLDRYIFSISTLLFCLVHFTGLQSNKAYI